jgi:two-component system, OmpR family, response regulator
MEQQMPATAVAGKCRTLIVEDDRSSCEALSKLLARFGYPVQCAMTLHEAQQRMAWGPGCVLLDLMLPDGNGIEILRKIREEGLATKVAVMTAVGDSQILSSVRGLNPDALFQKPVNIAQVMLWLDETAG